MPTTLDVFISSKMVELKAEREALYKLLPTLSFGDIYLRAWVFEKDAPATEKSIRDVYLEGLKNSALYIGLFWNQYSKDYQTPNWTIDEFDRATEWGIERHIYVKDVEAEKRDLRLTEFLNQHNDVQFGITANWYKTDVEFSEKVRQSITAWIQARQSHSTSPEALLIRNPNDLRRPKKMFGREALLTQIDSLVDDDEKVLLQGAGGMGKTAVAGEAAARFMARTAKPVLWLTIGSGEADAVFEALAQPAKMTKEVASASGEAKAQALKTAVRATGAGLVILDNAWNGAALHTTLNALPAELPVLVTSRQKYPLENVLEVGKLPAADALGLLTYHSKREADPDAPELCKKLGYLAFALEVAGKTMKMKQWAAAEMMNEIREAPHRLERPAIYGEQEISSVQDLLTASLHALPDADTRRVFLTFGAFFAPQLTPEMLQLYFAQADSADTGDDVSDVEGELSILEQYGLAEDIPAADNAVEHYQIHDLAYSFVRAQNNNDQHQRGLDACLAYVKHLKESILTNFVALRPELNNLLNAADWAFGVQQYGAVEELAWELYSGRDGKGHFLFYQGYSAQATRLLQLAVAAAKHAGNNLDLGSHLGNLGSAYGDLGQVQRAVLCYEQALTIARDIGHRQLEAQMLGGLGSTYDALGQIQRAVQCYEQALTIVREVGDSNGICEWLGRVGKSYITLGQVQRAIFYIEQALTIARNIRHLRNEGANLSTLGEAYYALGQIEQAILYYEETLNFARIIGDRRTEGHQLGQLGNAYYALNQVERAIVYHEQALTIAREIGDRNAEGSILGNLGIAYSTLGQVERAIVYHEQALTIAREIRNRRAEGSILGNLGIAHSTIWQIEKAIDCYTQSLQILHEIGDRMGEASALTNIGALHGDQGDLKVALDYFQEARTIFLQIGAHHKVKKVDNNIARMRSKLDSR